MGMVGGFVMVDGKTVKDVMENKISVLDVIYDESIDDTFRLSIDKAWHMIHFTVSGEIDVPQNKTPLSCLILNGKEISDEDIGYGSATYMTDADMKETCQAIAPIGEKEFRARFDFQRMLDLGIYPVFDPEADPEEEFDYAFHYFTELKKFLETAASKGLWVIFYIQ